MDHKVELISFPFSIFIALVGYAITCIGAGWLIILLLSYFYRPTQEWSATVRLVTSFVLGQGTLASVWLLLALQRLFSRPVVMPVLVVLGLLGLELLRREMPHFFRQFSFASRLVRNDTWGWQGLAGLTTILYLAWFTSIGRPMNIDAASLYMAFPKVIAASHRLIPLPGYETFADIGLQGELHYAIFMLFRVPDAARLFAWPTFLAAATILLVLGRQVGLGPRGQWLALAILGSSSAVINLSFDGKVDMFAVPLGLAAYYWILQIRGEQKQLALWLTGLFMGFACVAKISYIPVIAPGLLFLLVWQFYPELQDPFRRKKALKIIFLNGLQIMAGGLLAVAPHLIKNYFLYHNPFSPFGTGPGWVSQPWYTTPVIQRIILTYPLALTYGNYFAQYGNLSPLWLAFLPLIFLLPRSRSFFSSQLGGITLSALLGLLTWTLINPSNLAPRYYLAPLLLFILLPARSAEYVSYNDRKPRWLLFSVMSATYAVIFITGLYFLTEAFFPGRTYQYLTGNLSECDRDSSNYCKAMLVINKVAANGERVFLADWYRYWFRPDLLQCLSYMREMTEFNDLPTSNLKWQFLHEHGFTYLFIDKTTHSFVFDSLILESHPAWVKIKLLFSNEEETILAYKLKYINPPGLVEYSCRQLRAPAWDIVKR